MLRIEHLTKSFGVAEIPMLIAAICVEIDRLILRNYAMDDFEVLYEIMSDPALYQPISEKSVKFRLLVI